jgi:hypothetical protein
LLVTVHWPGSSTPTTYELASSDDAVVVPAAGNTNTEHLYQITPGLQQQFAIRVSSDWPITLQIIQFAPGLRDVYTALPLSMLGTEYVVGDFGVVDPNWFEAWWPWVQLVSVDATSITNISVTTPHNTTLGPPGTYNITLGPLHTLLIRAETPGKGLGGTRIMGSSPFAAMAGHTGLQLPPAGEWSEQP